MKTRWMRGLYYAPAENEGAAGGAPAGTGDGVGGEPAGDLELGGILGAAQQAGDAPAGDAPAGQFAAILDGIDPATVPAKYLHDGKLNAPAVLKAAADFEKQARAKAKVPDSAADYRFEVPEDLAHMLPQKQDADGNPVEDPLVAKFREFAHEAGMSQEQAGKVVPWFLQTIAELAPHAAEPQLSDADYFKAEIAKLGPNGLQQFQEMGAQVGRWVQLGVLSRDQAKAFTDSVTSAETFSAWNAVLRHMGMDVVPSRMTAADGTVYSREQLSEMRYARVDDGPNKGKLRIDVDPSYRAEVDAAYEAFHGTAPAGVTKIRQA